MHFEVKADRKLKTDPEESWVHLGRPYREQSVISGLKKETAFRKIMPLMVIEAMKMETTVISKVNGIVDKIYVKDGEEVNEDTLLASFIIDTDEQPEEVHPELPKMDLGILRRG